MPCQWIEVGDGKRLVTAIVTVSPSRHRKIGREVGWQRVDHQLEVISRQHGQLCAKPLTATPFTECRTAECRNHASGRDPL
jgi:hypothetical protein